MRIFFGIILLILAVYMAGFLLFLPGTLVKTGLALAVLRAVRR